MNGFDFEILKTDLEYRNRYDTALVLPHPETTASNIQSIIIIIYYFYIFR